MTTYNSLVFGLLTVCTFRGIEGENHYDEINRNVLSAYDTTKTFDDNFYAIQSIFCPKSTFCPDDIKHKSDWIHSILNGSNAAYELIFSNTSSTVDEARRKLLVLSLDIKGCCKACSCEKKCNERGNCCPMSSWESRMSVKNQNIPAILQECVHSSIKQYIRGKAPTSSEFYGQSYYMVVDCFNVTATNEQTQEKCRRPDVHFPDQVTPVYSLDTDRIYRNKFCAECNMDVNVISWTLQIVISTGYVSDSKFEFPSDPMSLYHFVIDNIRLNDIIFIPPEQLQLKEEAPLCVIHPKTFDTPSQCRPTHLQSYDLENFVQRACVRYGYVYKYFIRLYGNFFCYLCDWASFPTKDTVCFMDSHTLLKLFNTEFTAILSFDGSKTNNELIDENSTSSLKCGCNDYFDFRQNSCRKMFCPLGETSAGCTCRGFTKAFSGLPARVYTEVTVEVPPNDIPTVISRSDFAQVIKSFVLEYFDSYRKSLRRSVFAIYLDNKTFDKKQLKLHVLCTISVKHGYNGREEMKKILDQLQKGWTTRSNRIQMTLSLGPIYDIFLSNDKLLTIVENSSTSLGINSTNLLSGPTSFGYLTDMSILNYKLFCNRIKMNDDETVGLLVAATEKGYVASRLSYIYFKEDKSICIDDYLNIFRNVSSATCNTLMTLLQIGWILLMIIIFGC